MDDNRISMADIVRTDVAQGDRDSLRLLCNHAAGYLRYGNSVDTKSLQLLLEHLPVKVATEKQEQYGDIFRSIEVQIAKKRLTFYQAVKDFHASLKRQKPEYLTWQ